MAEKAEKKIYIIWCNHINSKNNKICGRHERAPTIAYENRTVEQGVQVQHTCVNGKIVSRIINKILKKCEYCHGAGPCIVLGNDNNNDEDDDIQINDCDESTVSSQDDNNNFNNQQNKIGVKNELKDEDEDDQDNDGGDEHLFQGKYSASYLEKEYHRILEIFYGKFDVEDYYECRELQNLCSTFGNNFFVEKITEFTIKDMIKNNNYK